MPKKKTENELSQKEQSERFKKTARELGADDEKASEMFQKSFKTIATTKPKKTTES